MMLLRRLLDYRRFTSLPRQRRRLVIYSEAAASWPHLQPVVDALLSSPEVPPMVYLSSSATDPGLERVGRCCPTFEIGSGFARTLFLNTLDADLLLSTTPDLQTFHLKRSRGTRRYVYLHHSLVSTHMVYRPAAFDHFDVVLCAGPHHEREIRAREQLLNLPPKTLVPHGYGRLDSLIADAVAAAPPVQSPTVLVAPSWGPSCLLEAWAEPLLTALQALGWPVIVRPHPRSLQLDPGLGERLQAWKRRWPALELDFRAAGHDSLRQAAVMVSDWSGAAFDFALGYGRPVLFVDTPCKVNNPDHAAIGITPIEVWARDRLGVVLGTDELACLPQALPALLASGVPDAATLAEFRSKHVYHVGRSGRVAADWLSAALAEIC